MNEIRMKKVMEELLGEYPNAVGVSFHSMESALETYVGDYADILEKYKDIPMMSVDEEFQTEFNYIITNEGSIITFFINGVHFVSIFIDTQDPNKQLALRMYNEYKSRFESLIQ